MGAFQFTFPFTCLLLLAVWHALPGAALGFDQLNDLEPKDACSDFGANLHPVSAWSLDDCLDVWTQYETTIPSGLRHRSPDVDIWKSASLALRGEGSPCMVKANFAPDGAGSTTMRNLATWIFAEELGCEWVTPTWSGKSIGNGTIARYCHRTSTLEEAKLTKKGQAWRAMNRCSIIDWLSYFQFNIPSVDWPEGGKLKIIQPDNGSFAESMSSTWRDLEKAGVSQQPWDRVVFSLPGAMTSRSLVTLSSWDSAKREVARNVLREARQNFHRHPRPWYEC